MNNLQLLQRVCESANIEYPTGLTSLTPEQDQILRYIDAKHQEICTSRKWWFLQRVADLTTLGYSEHATNHAAVTDQTTSWRVEITTSTPFTTALTKNGKMRIGNTGDAYLNDVVRVNATSTSQATIVSGSYATWPRGAVSLKDWWYGQDEYELAADCDDVAWMLLWRTGAATASLQHVVLEGISAEELDNIRRNRADFFTEGQPLRYCVNKVGTTDGHLRYVTLDPFPEASLHIVYGYYKRPTELYAGTTQTPDLPEKHQEVLVNAAIMYYYTTYGIGAPAGSPSGQEIQARLVEVQKDYVEGMQELMGDTRIAQEIPSFDAGSVGRTLYHDQLGRSI